MQLILIVVAVVSGLLGQPQQAEIIIVIIVLSAALGFYNEFRATKLVEDLESTVSLKAVVTRDGKSAEIDASTIVPGDLATD